MVLSFGKGLKPVLRWFASRVPSEFIKAWFSLSSVFSCCPGNTESSVQTSHLPTHTSSTKCHLFSPPGTCHDNMQVDGAALIDAGWGHPPSTPLRGSAGSILWRRCYQGVIWRPAGFLTPSGCSGDGAGDLLQLSAPGLRVWGRPGQEWKGWGAKGLQLNINTCIKTEPTPPLWPCPLSQPHVVAGMRWMNGKIDFMSRVDSKNRLGQERPSALRAHKAACWFGGSVRRSEGEGRNRATAAVHWEPQTDFKEIVWVLKLALCWTCDHT